MKFTAGLHYPVNPNASRFTCSIKEWFSISAYSPERGCFAAVFDVITERQPDGKYFRKLVDAMPDSIVVINPAREIILVNAQTENLFGYSRNEMLGKRLEFLVPQRYESRHRIHRLNYFETPHTRQMGAGLELFGLARDGTEFPVDVSLSPFQTEGSLLVIAAIPMSPSAKRRKLPWQNQSMIIGLCSKTYRSVFIVPEPMAGFWMPTLRWSVCLALRTGKLCWPQT